LNVIQFRSFFYEPLSLGKFEKDSLKEALLTITDDFLLMILFMQNKNKYRALTIKKIKIIG
jgi:hypothetical protein